MGSIKAWLGQGRGWLAGGWGQPSTLRLRHAIHRWRLPVCCALLVVSLLAITPWGCSPKAEPQSPQALSPHVLRVRLLNDIDQLTLRASLPPVYSSASDRPEKILDLPRNTPVVIYLRPEGWRVGGANLGRGELILRPAQVGSLAVNERAYRGQYRLVPVGGNRFDLINDVEVDDYLKSVVSRELFPNWHLEAYRAQAVAARTYALYERNLPREQPRYFDLHADQRSQVYGGLASETDKSRAAVDSTRGIVLAYGQPARIFKAYFSSCCGGVTQSAADAFADPYLPPLGERQVGAVCSASTRFTWGPVVVMKDELTRRFQAWGAAKGRPEAGMGLIRGIEIEARNRFQRPVRYRVTDVGGNQYILRSEELRWAVNTRGTDATTLPSSYIDSIVNESDRIRFIGGHGYGHGVGLCQWCIQAQAQAGVRHEDILLAAYPGAQLVRAY